MTAAIALEMVTRTTAGFRTQWLLLIPCVVVMLAVVAAAFTPQRAVRIVRGLLLIAAAAGAMVWASQLLWLCDDAFISFRYADNLARGHGLVYNVGDPVEGYTNFLWTLLLSGTRALGFDIPLTSLVLSLLAYATLIVFTDRLAELVSPAHRTLAIPLAALGCAAHYTLASFATSGLETMFGSLLCVIALERGVSGRWFASGAAGVLAAMTHPDLGILYAALGLALLLDRQQRRQVVRYALPFVLIYLPYFIWRVAYYGELFPNTYYAKSANLTYFKQGAIYLMSFLIGGGIWALAPLVVYGLWVQRGTLFGRYCMIGVPLFCVYVAKIGGDFMYGRLLTPLVAPLLVLGEFGVARLLDRRRVVGAALGALSLAVAAVPVRMIGPFEKAWEIADERTFYVVPSLDPLVVNTVYFQWAKTLLRYFPAHAPAPRLSMYSSGVISYYTGWPMLDGFGLTDRGIAHRPLVNRGRPGHEKHAGAMYVVHRDIDISDEATWPPPFHNLARLTIDGFKFNLVHYDPKVIAKLRNKPGVVFTDYERHLTSQLRLPVTATSAEQVQCAAWFADAYYFSRVPKSPLRRRMEKQLLAAGQAFHAKPKIAPLALDLDAKRVVHESASIHFEPSESARFMRTGKAFGSFPAHDMRPTQEWATGFTGAHASSFDPVDGAAATGHLTSKPFQLVGDVMELRVGGGPYSEQLRVSLIVDGQRMFSTAGCYSEMLGRRLWQIAPFKGKQAVLQIVDDARWGHLMVDEVVQWSVVAKVVPAKVVPATAPSP